ncbi:UdgX family uracil-DNA binding protein [Bradyrhizobium sp. BRP22]|uniref:UdgX family uracil-DNA binding protein n=1 Tax=Bradyrhizobium sp. BRP22 TaxID=2793821 RepID=UPI001CD4EC85|nr:UdgX family uracil-DNA binding protein [Bradyrhizobium sp. BRP22]MCA1456773.1 UdgX family uracil-DNA binding protein [Bradyrhizobium sp. BRP22]
MHHIILNCETDFDGWRTAARALVLNEVPPDKVTWVVRNHGHELSDGAQAPLEPPQGTFNVPAKFVELAKTAILHRDAERFALLYRLLWRLRRDHDLLDIAHDPDVARIHAMAKAVHHEAQRMRTSIRLREIGREHKSHFVAWFEPQHHVVELTAPFFASRFADMPWSILTPDVCAHWDGYAVSITPGISNAEMPAGNRLEELWQHHYAAIFNPARLAAKKARNLPAAPTIKLESESADGLGSATTAHAATEPQMPEPAMIRRAADSLSVLREEAADCRACHLYKHATQTVFGQGPQSAQVVLVGEQPGDKEDLAGKPFVGPAGLMLDRALIEAGIDRKKVYITNAVKHFKFVPRGKIRLHQKPNTPEIKACRQWYERELASIKPDLVVAMGATAAQCVFNKLTPINKNRGRLIDLDEGVKALVTVHPSYLLRLPDQDAKEREYQRFVEDLKLAAELLRKRAQAAA